MEGSFEYISGYIKELVSKTQLEIMIDANYKLVHLYFHIGRVLEENSSWGNKFIDHIASELKTSFPNLKGFSVRNLKYMKAFYNEYKDEKEFVQLVAQLPWKHNITLMQKIKDKDIRRWYMKRCLEEVWSTSILIYQIDTNLYYRQEKAVKHHNFDITLKKNSTLASSLLKDPYIFDLILANDSYKERDLEIQMVEKIKNVLLEFGDGFSFVGNQYKITFEHQDFYIDLLFYHIKLKCYIAVELKLGEFKTEFASKMGFYLTLLDEMVKDASDHSSIGIILCQNKNEKVVDYTLKYINKPVGVSEYKILDKVGKNLLKNLSFEEKIAIY